MEYRREIDGLRALAVLPVILFHAGFKAFSGGFVGVDIFFVISGFLITSIILGDAAAGRFSLLDFYDRRARRILPALYLVLLVCIPFAWIVLPPIELMGFSKSLASIPLFSSNFFFWRDGNYFETTAELKPLLHTWSLAVEEQYYLFFPIFLTFVIRAGWRWTFFLLSTVALFSLVFAQVLSARSPVANFFLLPTRAWELAIGALVACHLRRSSVERIPLAARQILSATGFALIVASILLFSKTTPFPGVAALAPTLGAALILMCAKPDTLAGRLLAMRVTVGIGLVSYSAYLWHQPLLALVRYQFPDPGPVFMAGLVGCTFTLAWLTWKYVERPFRIRGAFDRSTVFRWSALASAFLVLFGTASSRLFSTTSVCGVESRIARTLVGSRAVYASGLDERELVRYRIEFQPANPQVVVLGSSRIMQVGEHNLAPGTLNLAVSGASVEDLVAIGGLVSKRFKPATVLIGVDPWLFNGKSGQDRWKTLGGEYREQIAGLGGPDGAPINPAPVDGNPSERVNPLLRLGGRLYRSISRCRLDAKSDLPEDKDKIRRDGSRVYNVAYASKTQAEIARGFDRLMDYAMNPFESSATSRLVFEHFVRDWSKRARVILVLSPYHPELYGRMKRDGANFLKAETEFRELAVRCGVPIVGSYDPGQAGCGAMEFFDGMHPADACMEKLLSGTVGTK